MECFGEMKRKNVYEGMIKDAFLSSMDYLYM
jgi:hypothetical protein